MKGQRTGAADSALFINAMRGRAIDALDFRLLDALRAAPLASHAALAKKIERSESTVRRRIAALQDAGVLTGFIAVPAPSVLGLEGIAATWATSAPAADLLALPGTIMAGNTVGSGTLAGGIGPDATAWLAAAEAVVGAPATTRMPLDHHDGTVFGALDLRVLRAMVESPRGSAEDLARLCGLSAKTVRRRRRALLDAGAVKVYAMWATSAMDDLVYHLHVTCRPDQVGDVVALLGDVSVGPRDGAILCCFVRAKSLGEQARTLAAIEALGVERVEVVHEDEWEVSVDRLVAFVDEAIAAWA